MVFSGLSVHEEVQHLVESGLTTGEALLAATLWPARYSGVGNLLGGVEEGKRADLLLLDSNPLEDIKNTQSIEAVILNGHYYDYSALVSLEQYAAAMAQSIRVNVKLLVHMLLSPLMRVQLAD